MGWRQQGHWREGLRGIGERVRDSLSQGAGSARGEIDARVLVHDGRLILLEAGRSAELSDAGGPTALAGAAARLLGSSGGRPRRVALFLPPADFIATPYELPGVASEDVASALALQQADLVPGVDEELLLAVNPDPDDRTGSGVALWMSAQRAEELFQAFRDAGLFLACVAPRPVAVAAAGHHQVQDQDADFVTVVDLAGDRIARWLKTARVDLEDAHFRRQWEESTAQTQAAEAAVRAGADDWMRIVDRSPRAPAYCFQPRGAGASASRAATNRRRNLLIAAAVVVLLLLLLPFARLYWQEWQLRSELRAMGERAGEIRALQSRVVAMQAAWAPITEFPEPDVLGVLQTLNGTIPRNSWVSALHVKDGTVEFEGYSPNPARLVELLAQKPEFTDVAFSRASRADARSAGGDRFGMRFRLRGVDYEGYIEKHFPGAR